MLRFDNLAGDCKKMPTMGKKKAAARAFTYRPSPEVVEAIDTFNATLSPPDRYEYSELIDKAVREYLRNNGHTPADEPSRDEPGET